MPASPFPRVLGIALLASVTLAWNAHATEILVEGYKLVVKETATSSRIVYVSRDPGVALPLNVGVDPTLTGGTFLIRTFHAGTEEPEAASFPLPAGNWTAMSSPKGFIFKFTNPDAPDGVSGVRTVVIGDGRLKVRTMESGITLDEVAQSQMAVRLDIDDAQWCSSFSANIQKNAPGLFVVKRQGFPTASCTPASP